MARNLHYKFTIARLHIQFSELLNSVSSSYQPCKMWSLPQSDMEYLN